VFAADVVDVALPQLNPWLVLRCGSQHLLEGGAAAPQPHDSARSLRDRRRLGPCRDQGIEDLRHLGEQRIDHLSPEAVWMVELHHTFAGPVAWCGRSWISIHHCHLMVSAGQSDGEVEPSWACSDDGGPHVAHLMYLIE
jgi:hypothetical protein